MPLRPTPALPVLGINDIAPQHLPPKHVRLAPERLVSSQPVPAEGYVALVGRDLTGRLRFRIEIETENAKVVQWWIKAARYVLAVFYGAAEIHLVRSGEHSA